MLRLVILDLDGTLVSTVDAHVEAAVKALEKYGIKVNPHDVRDEIGKTFKEILIDLSHKYPELSKIPYEKIYEAKKEIFLELLDKVKLNRGAIELLSFLKENKIKVALATSSDRFYTEKILNKFGLMKYFDHIVTADDVERSKPEPDIFLKVLKDLEVSPFEALVIEDSVYGVVAAKRAGIPVFAVLTGTNKKKELAQLHPNKIFKDLYEIYKYLKERCKEGCNINI